jgi:hypothetical protein
MTTESEFCVRAPKSIVFLRLGLSYTPKWITISGHKSG